MYMYNYYTFLFTEMYQIGTSVAPSTMTILKKTEKIKFAAPVLVWF